MIDSNELPKGWAQTSLSEIAASIGGGTPPTTDPTFWEGGMTPWVSPKDMKVFRIRQTIDSVTDRALERLSLVPPNSVLVVVRSGILAHSLPVAINDCAVVLNQDMRAFVPHSEVNAAFVAWQLVALSGEVLERCTKDGTTVASIEASRLAGFALRLAPAAEQVRVVEAIESLLSALDVAIRDLEAGKRKLALYRQALLKSAVEGTLTADWRGGESTTSWKSATIGDLAEVGTGVTPRRSEARYFSGGTIPWVTSGALNSALVSSASDFVTEEAADECRLKLYPAGTLLVAMYGEGKTRGKCSELGIAATINQAIAAIVLKPSFENCRAFLKAFLWHSYESMRQQASGGVQPNLNLQIVKSISVPLPPDDEQQEIVRRLDGLLDAAKDQEEALDRALAMACAQRQNILRAAFSGQLVPQDPNDEPASVLLERIRAQRPSSATAAKRKPGRPAKVAA